MGSAMALQGKQADQQTPNVHRHTLMQTCATGSELPTNQNRVRKQKKLVVS